MLLARAGRVVSRGFTLLELAIVICIVALLMAIGLDRLLRYQELAEKVAMENAASVMRSALGMRFAALYLQGDLAAIDRLPSENPIDWLAERPPNYLGALWAPDLDAIPSGSWYYDQAAGDLVYVPDRRRHLSVPPSGDPRIRFRVSLDFSSPGPKAPRALNRLGLDLAAPYDWFGKIR